MSSSRAPTDRHPPGSSWVVKVNRREAGTSAEIYEDCLDCPRR